MTFLDYYLAYCGDSEVPRRWHMWACLSLIAAAVADRVGIDIGGSKWLAPNLYVFLVGPSGSGKEMAISKATSLAKDIPAFNISSGEITTRGLFNLLGTKDQYENFTKNKAWLVMEELAQCISLRDEGRRLLKNFTKMYGRDPLPLDNRTGKYKHVTIPDLCLNIIAGTTKNWLFDTISAADIHSGAFARIVSIVDARDYEHPRPRIQRPGNYYELVHYLKQAAEWYTVLKAEARVHPEVYEWHEQWYCGKTQPDDELLIPHYNRRDELLHKVAAVLGLAKIDFDSYSPGEPVWLRLEHFIQADYLIQDAQKDLPMLLNQCGQGVTIQFTDMVARYIQRHRVMAHRDLLQKVSPRGVTAQQLRMIVDHLQQEERVVVESIRPLTYRWVSV